MPLNISPIEQHSIRGLGLESMQERVELTAGEFAIESQYETGTRIECLWDCEVVTRTKPHHFIQQNQGIVSTP